MAKRAAARWTADDRLGDAIADDPRVVERLAALDERLRISQSRDWVLSIAAVAAKAGLGVATVLSAVNASRGSACRDCQADDDEDGPAETSPTWLTDTLALSAERVDVRPLLAKRGDPFVVVMEAAKAVPPEDVLVIDAPFDAKPLRRVLETKAFETYGQRIEAGHWRIWCRRAALLPRNQSERTDGSAASRVWRDGSVVHIDVRGLEAPAPLVAILTLIDGGPHEGVIIVHHHRDPLYLYPELAERGWGLTRLPSPPDEVRLELRREQ